MQAIEFEKLPHIMTISFNPGRNLHERTVRQLGIFYKICSLSFLELLNKHAFSMKCGFPQNM